MTGVTARDLAGLPRPARLWRICGALSPAGRERAWARLDEEQRVEAVAAMFDAAVRREPPLRSYVGETRATAQARWEAEADQ